MGYDWFLEFIFFRSFFKVFSNIFQKKLAKILIIVQNRAWVNFTKI